MTSSNALQDAFELLKEYKQLYPTKMARAAGRSFRLYAEWAMIARHDLWGKLDAYKRSRPVEELTGLAKLVFDKMVKIALNNDEKGYRRQTPPYQDLQQV